MKHLVYGSGLIGSYLASCLAATDHKVNVIGRRHFVDKLSQGAVLTDYQGNHSQAPQVYKAAQDDQFDCVWVTLKATQVADSLDDIKAKLAPYGRLVVCQNGLYSERQFKGLLNAHQTLVRAMWQSNVSETDQGFHRGSEGVFVIENMAGMQPVADQLNQPILPTQSTTQFESIAWAKLQLNLGNGVNALLDISVLEMLNSADARWVIAQLMHEMLCEAKAKGVPLARLTPLTPSYIPKLMKLPNWLYGAIMKRSLQVDPTVRTSMWHDIKQGKRTERDYIYGQTIGLATEAGRDVPAHQVIYQMLGLLEAGELKLGELKAGELAKPITARQLKKQIQAAKTAAKLA